MAADRRRVIEEFQTWMLDLVMHPDGVLGAADEGEIGERVLPSRSLSPTRRLSIYADMYYWRLIDILRDEYEAVNHLLGNERFSELARDYLSRHPSRSENLRLLGAEFPAFLSEEAEDLEHRELLVELARLERAIEEVFAEDRSETISGEDLERVPGEDWPAMAFRFVPALRLLELRRPAHAYYQAFRDDAGPDPADFASGIQRVLVYRRDWTVWRARMEAVPHAILERLLAGATLAEGLEAAAAIPGTSEEDVLSAIGASFRKWSGLGLIASLSPPGS